MPFEALDEAARLLRRERLVEQGGACVLRLAWTSTIFWGSAKWMSQVFQDLGEVNGGAAVPGTQSPGRKSCGLVEVGRKGAGQIRPTCAIG
jgi:hypothetical protein